MNLYCIHHIRKGTFDAASKAPEDVFRIAKNRMGAKEIVFYEPRITANRIRTNISALLTGMGNWLRLLMSVPHGAYVIMQHPLEGINVSRYMLGICKAKGIHFIGLIHDLDSLRQSLVKANDNKDARRSQLADNVLLKKCDYVICHNEKMRAYLVEQGFEHDRCISLKIFDYLCDATSAEVRKKAKEITIAGNLMRNKCGYLYSVLRSDSFGMTINLYGANFEENELVGENVKYHGSCSPSELPQIIKGSFGLVWDGDSASTCAGKAGEYLKYNNPHKTSLFLASGMPVVIWKDAALADFVLENDVGIVVGSILDIPQQIDSISQEDYTRKHMNALVISEKLRNGDYLADAIIKVEQQIHRNAK